MNFDNIFFMEGYCDPLPLDAQGKDRNIMRCIQDVPKRNKSLIEKIFTVFLCKLHAVLPVRSENLVITINYDSHSIFYTLADPIKTMTALISMRFLYYYYYVFIRFGRRPNYVCAFTVPIEYLQS